MTTPAAFIKSAETENFPVGSWLLPANLRPHVAIFYAFARTIDDIADSATLAAEDKIGQLDSFSRALDDGNENPLYLSATRLHQSLRECGISHVHGHNLISAFKQDAIKNRYANWNELITYCNRSASPVGRYLLDLHGEDPAHYSLSDALCNALQVINHCQDMADDKHTLNRVYVPTDWLNEAGALIEDIGGTHLTAALRVVLDRCLDATELLLQLARKLPMALKSKRLSAEASVIVAIAEKLVEKLRQEDPIAKRVKLTKFSSLICAGRGLLRTL